MRLALIPPTELIEECAHLSEMQLVLPTPWLESEEYRVKMDLVRRTHSHYRILDNGAAESEQIDDEVLMELIGQTEPDEFALPDVLGDFRGTYRSGMEFIEKYGERLKQQDVKVGLVAQGSNGVEAVRMVEEFYKNSYGIVDVVYIPRLHVREGKLIERALIAETLSDMPVEFHLFGMNRKFPYELQVVKWWLSTSPVTIRSVDTALPFYCAKASSVLWPSMIRLEPAPTRSDDYFEEHYTDDEKTVVDRNIATVKEWIS